MGLSHYIVNVAVYFPISKIDWHRNEILKGKPLQIEFHGIFEATLNSRPAQKQAWCCWTDLLVFVCEVSALWNVDPTTGHLASVRAQ